MDGYKLSRNFWDFSFNNPEKIKPNHIAIYFFAVEHCNRLGWKQKFGLPASMVIEAIGIKSYSVYKKSFDELVDFGFFEVLQYSKNQYSSNIIALKENYKAPYKALDKAFIKHVIKQSESTQQSTYESTVSINKQLTINKETINHKNKEQNLIEIFFKDLENSSALETIARNNQISINWVKEQIPLFRSKAELNYLNFERFLNHFKNFIHKQIENQINGKQGNKNIGKASIDGMVEQARKLLTGNHGQDNGASYQIE